MVLVRVFVNLFDAARCKNAFRKERCRCVAQDWGIVRVFINLEEHGICCCCGNAYSEGRCRCVAQDWGLVRVFMNVKGICSYAWIFTDIHTYIHIYIHTHADGHDRL